MEESAYQVLTDAAFRRLEAGIDAIDAEVVDIDRAGDVVTLTFASKVKCIVNTQRPTRQIWVAARDRAWHFSYDGSRWLDDKDRTTELFETLARVVKEQAGVDVSFA